MKNEKIYQKRASKKEIIEFIDNLRFIKNKMIYEENEKDNPDEYTLGYLRGEINAYNLICDIMVITGYNIK